MTCRARSDETLRSTARILAFGLPLAIITIFPMFNYLAGKIRCPAWDIGYAGVRGIKYVQTQ
jgi:hypothetical protein